MSKLNGPACEDMAILPLALFSAHNVIDVLGDIGCDMLCSGSMLMASSSCNMQLFTLHGHSRGLQSSATVLTHWISIGI